ncbi:PREDICTED: protamine-like [Nicrophorus vespilloides]|uniref:Protamine-like n=1 Tax=Nicrophorus vespilloides TaxID=110193 RepID=A0ABM1ND25_NICVS|nr:PREDICTED: protamine-like [Nicrophorus vespilloides]
MSKESSVCPPISEKNSNNVGKVTRNPFLNFLRQYRTEHCDWKVVQVAVEGAKVWHRLPEPEKARYRQEACGAPKISYKKRIRSKRRRRRAKNLKKNMCSCRCSTKTVDKCRSDGFFQRLFKRFLYVVAQTRKEGH